MKISICDICNMPLERGALRHSIGKLFWRVDICAECMSLIKSERSKEIKQNLLEPTPELLESGGDKISEEKGE